MYASYVPSTILRIRTDYYSKHARGPVAVTAVNSVDSIYVCLYVCIQSVCMYIVCMMQLRSMNFHCHTLLSVISITRDSNRLLTICSHRQIHIYALNLANQNSYTCISTFNSHLDLRYKLEINHCHFEESGVLLFEKKQKQN